MYKSPPTQQQLSQDYFLVYHFHEQFLIFINSYFHSIHTLFAVLITIAISIIISIAQALTLIACSNTSYTQHLFSRFRFVSIWAFVSLEDQIRTRQNSEAEHLSRAANCQLCNCSIPNTYKKVHNICKQSNLGFQAINLHGENSSIARVMMNNEGVCLPHKRHHVWILALNK